MVTKPTEVLSYQEMKDELRLDDDEHQSLIEGQIAAAVSWVEKLCGKPILDTTVTLYRRPPARRQDPIFVQELYGVQQVTLRYWPPGYTARVAPPIDLDMTELGAVRETTSYGGHAIYPPPLGWPDLEPDTMLVVEAVCGIGTADKLPAGLRLAIVAATRHLYEGGQDLHPTHTLHALIAPYKRVTYGRGA